MKYFLIIAILGSLVGCVGESEDTGSDTAEATDTSDSASE